MFYGHAMFIGGNSQKGSRNWSFMVYRCCVQWIQNWLQFEQHFSTSVFFISFVKDLPANVIKCHHHFKPCNFSLFDQRSSDKLEKINASLLSGWLIPFKKNLRGPKFSGSEFSVRVWVRTFKWQFYLDYNSTSHPGESRNTPSHFMQQKPG